ncbi:MAG TPA: peptide chain release factor N(5)-glutamine methyltransferase [Gemmatimonadaceae bacterium]|nr:peptide chain release factor N(5)-glutamine methyltransferase [Gemmatimonadaceae bacterium]
MADLTAILTAGGVEQAREEARDIVAAVHDETRFWPTLNPGRIVESVQEARALRAARLRAAGAPFAYAVGRAAFRFLTLDVDERVLIPRQETEQLVQAVLECAAGHTGGVAVDIGTGSGAIALALASEGCFERVIATDVSLGALEVARQNAQRLAPVLRCPVELRAGSLLAPLAGVRAAVVVSNPPYIAAGEAPELPSSVRDWEPPVALFSGVDGMAATLHLIRAAAPLLEPGGLLALEVDVRRASLAVAAAEASGDYAQVSLRLDLAGRERILLATRKAS